MQLFKYFVTAPEIAAQDAASKRKASAKKPQGSTAKTPKAQKSTDSTPKHQESSSSSSSSAQDASKEKKPATSSASSSALARKADTKPAKENKSQKPKEPKTQKDKLANSSENKASSENESADADKSGKKGKKPEAEKKPKTEKKKVLSSLTLLSLLSVVVFFHLATFSFSFSHHPLLTITSFRPTLHYSYSIITPQARNSFTSLSISYRRLTWPPKPLMRSSHASGPLTTLPLHLTRTRPPPALPQLKSGAKWVPLMDK